MNFDPVFSSASITPPMRTLEYIRTYVLYKKCVPIQYYTVLHSTTQYCTVLHSTAQSYTVLYSITQYYTVLHSTAQYYTALHSTTQYYTVLHSTAQYYTVLHSPTQYCTVLHSTTQFCNDQYNNSRDITSPLARLIIQVKQEFPEDLEDKMRMTKARVKRKMRIKQEESVARVKMTNNLKRHVQYAKEKGSSVGLSALPLEMNGFALHKSEFLDVISLRYL